MGKRNIEIIPDGEMRCEFRSGDRELIIKPKPIDFPEKGDRNYDVLIEELAARMHDLDDSELFSIVSC